MWIKLEDRKPLYGDYSVLVYHSNGSVEMCHVDDLRGGYSEYTHWMELPSPPNSEQAESPATDTQQANYEICPKCGGSGRVYMCAEDGDGIKCHKCSGSGKLS